MISFLFRLWGRGASPGMVVGLIVIALAATGCHGFRRGPSPEQAVLTAAYDFRWLAAAHYARALSTYSDPALCARFESDNGRIWPATDPRLGWAYFFNTSIMVMGGSFNNTVTVGFYHPWSDVMLITAWWSPAGAAPRLYDTEIVTGDFIRRGGQPPFSTLRPWMRKNEYRPVGAGLATAETVRDFEYYFKSVQPNASGWRSVIPGLADEKIRSANNYSAGAMLMANLGELSGLLDPKDDAGRALREKFNRLINDAMGGDLRELTGAPQSTPEAKTALAELRPAYLRRFLPAAFIGGKQKSLIMLTRADNPDLYLALVFKSAGGAWSLERADLLSFRKFYDLGPQVGGN